MFVHDAILILISVPCIKSDFSILSQQSNEQKLVIIVKLVFCFSIIPSFLQCWLLTSGQWWDNSDNKKLINSADSIRDSCIHESSYPIFKCLPKVTFVLLTSLLKVFYLSMKYESGDMPSSHQLNERWIYRFWVQFMFSPVEVWSSTVSPSQQLFLSVVFRKNWTNGTFRADQVSIEWCEILLL